MELYGPYSNDAPEFAGCVERIKKHIVQPSWSSEEREIAALLLVGLLHPNPKTRFNWNNVFEWFSLHESIPTTFSSSVRQALELQSTKSRTSKSVELNFDIIEELEKPPRSRANMKLDLFWNLCANCSIPPFLAVEILRMKFKRAYSIQETQSLLFIFECVHGYMTANMSSQLCFISPEDVWGVLKESPQFDAATIQLAASLKSTPFKLCCMAAEIATTGTCENPEKLEETKIMHLSTSAPYFGAYGLHWKSQKDLRCTWLRLLTLGLMKP
jgi:hypothetical protein